MIGAGRYWPRRYFAPRYWAKAGAVIIVAATFLARARGLAFDARARVLTFAARERD
jgi:hypothetical protein